MKKIKENTLKYTGAIKINTLETLGISKEFDILNAICPIILVLKSIIKIKTVIDMFETKKQITSRAKDTSNFGFQDEKN